MTRKSATLTLLVAVLMLAGPVTAEAHAPHDAIWDVAISPDYSTDSTVMAIARDALLRSTDGGDTWSGVSNGLTNRSQLRAVEISPADSSIVLVGSDGDGIFRSNDAGHTFEPVADLADLRVRTIVASPHDPQMAAVIDLSGEMYMTTGDGWQMIGTGVTAVGFDRDDASAVLRGFGDGRSEQSADNGDTWTESTLIASGSITAITGLGHDTVVMGTDRGAVLRSIDGGRHFEPINHFTDTSAVSSIEATTAELWIVEATVGPHRSTDDGRTWTRPGDGLTTDPQSADPVYNTADFAAISGVDNESSRVTFLAGFDGIFRSHDSGANWHELDTLSDIVVGMALSPSFADDETLFVNTYVGGSYRSVDGGRSWQAVSDDLRRGAGYARLFNVVLSPSFDRDGIMFSSTHETLLHSRDGGSTWHQIEVGGLDDDPDRNRIDIIRLSPSFPEDETVFVATEQGAVLASFDGGAEFERLAQLPGRLSSLTLSPNFRDDRTVFAGVRTRNGPADEPGVWRSVDAGLTWAPTSMRIETRLLAISPGFADDGVVFATSGQGFYLSNDRGETWTKSATDSLPAERIEAIAISPDFVNDETVLLSVRGRGLFRSSDAGKSFAEFARSLLAANIEITDFVKPTATPIRFSPDYELDATIFAFGGSDIVVSHDRGETWAITPRPPGPAGEFRTVPAIEEGGGLSNSARALILVALAATVALALFGLRRRGRREPDRSEFD